jgi:AraC-like DNA-binding protein
MYYSIIKPSAALSRVIDYYWIVENRESRLEHRELVYPQGFLQLMFYFNGTFSVRSGNGAPMLLPGACVCGLKKQVDHVTTAGPFGLLGVVFHAAAARQVFGFPLHEVMGKNLSLADWIGNAGLEVEERISLARDHRERISVLEAFLLGRLSAPKPEQIQLTRVVKLLELSEGKIPLYKLADVACLSERQFERHFAGWVGASPTHFRRILRINKAISLADKNHYSNLAALAVDAGYYDQSHFIHDFRDMIGITPSEFLSMQCNSPEFRTEI